MLALFIAGEGHAQSGVPFARYRTIETPHFILTFETRLEDYARRTARQAEAAHEQLVRVHGTPPRSKIRLVIVDQGDVFNGSATPIPTNRIVAFAHTPVEDNRFYTSDPLELLVTHELAHVFHLDQARGGWRVLRGVFGRGELTFPHLFDGSYLIEGLATYYESALTDGGRVRGAVFAETLRAQVLETQGPHIDEAESDPGAWPLDRHYLLGGLFLNHLATRYGTSTTPDWMARRAGSFLSVVSRGAATGDLLGGRSLTQVWNDWITTERDEAVQLRERLRATPPGVAQTTRVCDVAHNTSYPRVSPDGMKLAFLTTDEGRQPLGLYVADLQSCRRRRLARLDGAHALAWSRDGRSIVVSQAVLVDNVRLFGDLFRIDAESGARTRLTRSARLSAPDVHPSGRSIVAVQYDGDRSRLVSVDAVSGAIAPLTLFAADVTWGPARWSPDGTRLVAVRFTRGASFDLVLLADDGRLIQPLTNDRAIEGIPEWDTSAPPGVRRVFFTSDRSGIRELYSLELEGDAILRLYLTARVPTGMHEVALVPSAASGRVTVVATVTHADGRHLERFEVERSAWVEAPPPVAEYAARSSAPAEPVALATEAPRPYSPLRDLFPTGWSPVFGAVAELGTFVGAATGGVDVIGRHQWQGSAAYGPDSRIIASAGYVYRRFAHTQLFGQVASNWRLEQRAVSPAGELLRLERTRSAAVGVVFPWQTLRRSTVLSTSLRIEERHRENVGDASAVVAAGSPAQLPALIGGGVGLSFGNVQAGLRSISVQDGVRMAASADYLKATDGDRWRSGWDVSAAAYRSFPSWTTSGRPVLAVAARAAEQRGPAAGRLTAGGIGTTAILDGSTSNFEVRGYPPGFVAAPALWSARLDMRLPIARVSRGLGVSPVYLRGLSASWFTDSVGGASRAESFGAPQLVSTGAELSTDVDLFSLLPIRVRTGIGVPLRSLGPVRAGDARFYVTAGTW